RSIVPPNSKWPMRYTDVALFFQDSWRIRRRLAIMPGIRWEYFGVQSLAGDNRNREVNFYPGYGTTDYDRFANGNFLRSADAPGRYRNHMVRPDRNNFAPRLGLALNLTGKTVFRAGGGVFFDAAFGRDPLGVGAAVDLNNAPLEMLLDPYAVRWQGADLIV